MLVVALTVLVMAFLVFKYAALWLQAYMSGTSVSLLGLIGMSLRQVNPAMIVTAKVMGGQAGLDIDRDSGMTTAGLEAHYLAGGNVMRVLQAIIAANRSGIQLDFDRAAAIDLAAATYWMPSGRVFRQK